MGSPPPARCSQLVIFDAHPLRDGEFDAIGQLQPRADYKGARLGALERRELAGAQSRAEQRKEGREQPEEPEEPALPARSREYDIYGCFKTNSPASGREKSQERLLSPTARCANSFFLDPHLLNAAIVATSGASILFRAHLKFTSL